MSHLSDPKTTSDIYTVAAVILPMICDLVDDTEDDMIIQDEFGDFLVTTGDHGHGVGVGVDQDTIVAVGLPIHPETPGEVTHRRYALADAVSYYTATY